MRTTMRSIAGLAAPTVAVHTQTPGQPAIHEPLAWRLQPAELPYAAIDFRYAPALEVLGGRSYWHSDLETSDVIPVPALAGTTRACAKIIDDMNGIDINDLQPVAQR